MNGTLGYSEGRIFEGVKFPSSYDPVNNLAELDTTSLRRFFKVYSDSISDQGSMSVGEGGVVYGLHFIPGTATQGKIEVEFWERTAGFF